LRFGAPPASTTPVSPFTLLDIDLAAGPPKVGVGRRPKSIAAIAKWKDEFIIVPNMKQILN
jgi:hypothetical protein